MKRIAVYCGASKGKNPSYVRGIRIRKIYG